MTTHSQLTAAKIGQIRDDFLRSDAGLALSAEDASRLRRFVTWCGVSTSVEAVPAFKIEEFLALQQNTSTPPRTYMVAIKAFFQFAVQRGTIPADPMKTVRLPRGSGATKRATPASTAAAKPKAAPFREMDVVYVSRPQREAMQAELEQLRGEERHRVAQMLFEAIKDGDLSESAAYDDAKMRQGMMEARIRELEAKLRNIELIEDQDRSGAGVAVGSQVKLEELHSGEFIQYQVVGPDETNPRGGKISHQSPVGRALMGKEPGTEIAVTTPGGSVRYRIVSVE